MFVQKFKFILMKCTKTVATRAASFGSDLHQIVFVGKPQTLAGLEGGPQRKGRMDGRGKEGARRLGVEGREGRESRNAKSRVGKPSVPTTVRHYDIS